jgi:hypothetical protein
VLAEDDVLYTLKEFLVERGWTILAYRSPGGHGGLLVRPLAGALAGKQFVLDLIATRERVVVCLEAKAEASRQDQAKLDALFGDQDSLTALRAAVSAAAGGMGMELGKAQLVKGLAYGTGHLLPSDHVVFVVEAGRRVTWHAPQSLTSLSSHHFERP